MFDVNSLAGVGAMVFVVREVVVRLNNFVDNASVVVVIISEADRVDVPYVDEEVVDVDVVVVVSVSVSVVLVVVVVPTRS